MSKKCFWIIFAAAATLSSSFSFALLMSLSTFLHSFIWATFVSGDGRNMENLPPTIKEEFVVRGNWVVQKTARFSSIPIDQAHEQNNELKGPGGAVGLTENPQALKKWMIAGPEQACPLNEFEQEYTAISEDDYHHHEEGLSAHRHFTSKH